MGGWLVESGWLTTRKPGVKRSFVDLKIAPKTEAGRNLEAGFEFLKVCGEATSHF